jgi:hypothetical protein
LGCPSLGRQSIGDQAATVVDRRCGARNPADDTDDRRRADVRGSGLYELWLSDGGLFDDLGHQGGAVDDGVEGVHRVSLALTAATAVGRHILCSWRSRPADFSDDQ